MREKLPLDASTLGSLRPALDAVRMAGRDIHLKEALRRLLAVMIDATGAERGSLVLFKGGEARIKGTFDRRGNALEGAARGISAAVLRQVRISESKFVTADARDTTSLRPKDGSPVTLVSVLCVPFRAGDKLIGAFHLDHSRPSIFGVREIQLAELLAEHASVAVDNDRLVRQARRDRLTDLFNHAFFEKRLAREVDVAKRKNRPLGLLMVDLDDFKGINDTHGHEAGNAVLKAVARTLVDTVRVKDIVARRQPMVARFGGDEFEILLPGADRSGTKTVADRLVAALGGKRLSFGNASIRISMSVGGAVYPQDASTAQELRERADAALYESKRAGKNRAALFTG